MEVYRMVPNAESGVVEFFSESGDRVFPYGQTAVDNVQEVVEVTVVAAVEAAPEVVAETSVVAEAPVVSELAAVEVASNPEE